MAISDEEAAAFLDGAVAGARLYTDVMLSVPKDGGEAGLSSCVHVKLGARHLVVTCNHVLADGHVYFTAPQRTASDMVSEEQAQTTVTSVNLMARNEQLDLAVFDGSGLDLEGTGKCLYPLEQSNWFSVENLKPDGTAAFIYGVWGGKAKLFQYPDKLVYLDAPIYTALGPVVSAKQDSVVADMSEAKIVRAGERFKDEAATGGSRPLHGISGSGLWMLLDKSVCLAGVVLGSKGNAPTKHLIRTTPVWALRSWLEDVLNDG